MTRAFIFFLSLLFPTMWANACNIDIFANENMKPKAYLEKGQAKGILIDMMDYVGKDIGCTFNYHFSTWARAYKNMSDNKGGIIGLSFTQSRTELIDYSEVMYNEDVLLVSNVNSPIDYSNINDLKGKTLVASRSALYSDEFEEALKNKLFTFLGDNGDPVLRLKRVAKGRVDAALISPGFYAFNSIVRDHPEILEIKDQLYISPNKFTLDPNYLGFSKQSNQKEFLKKFNQSMRKAKEIGIFEDIEHKYEDQYLY